MASTDIAAIIREVLFDIDTQSLDSVERLLAMADEIVAGLDALGYTVRKKTAPRKSVEVFAPNTGNPDVDEFMRKHHRANWKPRAVSITGGLPKVKVLTVSEFDRAEHQWKNEADAAFLAVASGKRSEAEETLRALIALHSCPWRKVSSSYHDSVEVTTYRSERHDAEIVERYGVRDRRREASIVRLGVNVATHPSFERARDAADAYLIA